MHRMAVKTVQLADWSLDDGTNTIHQLKTTRKATMHATSQWHSAGWLSLQQDIERTDASGCKVLEFMVRCAWQVGCRLVVNTAQLMMYIESYCHAQRSLLQLQTRQMKSVA